MPPQKASRASAAKTRIVQLPNNDLDPGSTTPEASNNKTRSLPPQTRRSTRAAVVTHNDHQNTNGTTDTFDDTPPPNSTRIRPAAAASSRAFALPKSQTAPATPKTAKASKPRSRGTQAAGSANPPHPAASPAKQQRDAEKARKEEIKDELSRQWKEIEKQDAENDQRKVCGVMRLSDHHDHTSESESDDGELVLGSSDGEEAPELANKELSNAFVEHPPSSAEEDESADDGDGEDELDSADKRVIILVSVENTAYIVCF